MKLHGNICYRQNCDDHQNCLEICDHGVINKKTFGKQLIHKNYDIIPGHKTFQGRLSDEEKSEHILLRR